MNCFIDEKVKYLFLHCRVDSLCSRGFIHTFTVSSVVCTHTQSASCRAAVWNYFGWHLLYPGGVLCQSWFTAVQRCNCATVCVCVCVSLALSVTAVCVHCSRHFSLKASWRGEVGGNNPSKQFPPQLSGYLTHLASLAAPSLLNQVFSFDHARYILMPQAAQIKSASESTSMLIVMCFMCEYFNDRSQETCFVFLMKWNVTNKLVKMGF